MRLTTRTARPAGLKNAPRLEPLELRRMLDAASGFLVGTVYAAPAGASGFQDPGAPMPNVPVLLYKDGVATPVQTVTTDAKGAYAFNGLAPGGYTIVEAPGAGSAFLSSRVLSQVYPASGAGTNAVHVTVTDPASVWLNYNGIVPSSFLAIRTEVNGSVFDNSVGPLSATLGTAAGKADLNAGFQTFCVDDLLGLSYAGGEQFRVLPKPITALTDGHGNPIPADRAGRIAYLYNQSLTQTFTKVQGAALQLAIWELIYDTGPADFSSGNFKVIAPLDPADAAAVSQAVALAVTDVNASAGHADSSFLLDTNGLNDPAKLTGFQSMLATERFDFVNVPKATVPASLSGTVYCDPNKDGVQEPTEEGIGGVAVTLTGRDASGAPVSLATTTLSAPDAAGHAVGYYQFPSLKPGVYTIDEGAVAGHSHVTTTQGTPGNGVASTAKIADLTLAAGVNGMNNDFGEIQPPVDAVVSLVGVHRQATEIVLNLTSPLDPIQARNPANYTLIALGKDETLGTRDDVPVGIRAIAYDAQALTVTILPDRHLNIHYHYLLVARFTGDACTPPSTVVKVLGRVDVPLTTIHGKVQPPPPTPLVIAHNQKVVTRAIAAVAKNPAAYGAPAKVAALKAALAAKARRR